MSIVSRNKRAFYIIRCKINKISNTLIYSFLIFTAEFHLSVFTFPFSPFRFHLSPFTALLYYKWLAVTVCRAEQYLVHYLLLVARAAIV